MFERHEQCTVSRLSLSPNATLGHTGSGDVNCPNECNVKPKTWDEPMG